MTGNTTSVLIGLGLVALVLPLGLLVLARANTTIERQHPFDLGRMLPAGEPDAQVPAQRGASGAPQVQPTEGAKERTAAGA
jgi:hypothetical protein